MTHKHVWLLVVASAIGCGDDSPGSGGGSCRSIDGEAWNFRYVPRRGTSTCDDYETFDVVAVWGGGDSGESSACDGRIIYSDDGCEFTYANLACPLDNGGVGTTSGKLRMVNDDRIEGTLQFDFDSAYPCTTIYDVTATPL